MQRPDSGQEQTSPNLPLEAFKATEKPQLVIYRNKGPGIYGHQSPQSMPAKDQYSKLAICTSSTNAAKKTEKIAGYLIT
jgi:hypothetical protein